MSDDGSAKDVARAAREGTRAADGAPASEAGPKAASGAAPSQDVVLLGPKTADGNGVHVLRARNDQVEAGELRALREGQPITGEIVKLEPRKDAPLVCDVRESWKPPTSMTAPARKGPAQVATPTYRDHWEEIFGARSTPEDDAHGSN